MKKLDLISSIQKENEVNKEPNVDNVTQNIIYNNLLQKEKEDIHWWYVDEEEGGKRTQKSKPRSLVKEKRIKKKAQGLKDLFKTKKNTGKNYQKSKHQNK